MKKYNSYKESDISWLGEIPKHWQVSKVKHILFHKKKTSNPELNCGSISFGEIVYKDDESIPEHTKAAYQELLVGEFLINPLNLNFDLKSLRTALSDKNVVVSTGYIVLKNDDKTDKRFIKWLLHQFDVSFMKTLGAGVRQTLNYTDVKNSYFPVLPKQEQTTIANFLDYKTEKINRFIAQKKQLIELLHEQKAAIINQAVTKGINPNVPMKDSGIEWLGEIPKHWECWKMSRAYKCFGSGTTPKSGYKKYYENGVIPWVNTGDLNNSILYECEQKITELAMQDYSVLKSYPKGTISIAMYGASIGKISIVDFEFTSNQACCNIHSSEILLDRFTFYWFIGNKLRIVSLGYGGTQPNISQNLIKSLKITVPPFEEQKQIVNYIETETKRIDKTISTIEKEITLVEEYKTALIAEAVTGKIDVRNWSEP